MRLRVSTPGNELKASQVEGIEKDLEKIDRRLAGFKEEVAAEVRINDRDGSPGFDVVLELHYGPNHLVAKAHHEDLGQAVRATREEVLRQINDRSRGGHSSFSRGR